MKKFLSLLLIVLWGTVLSARQMTVIGVPGKLKLDSYPLKVNKFTISAKEKLTNIATLRICESVDNSKFLYFPAHPKAYAAREFFSSPAVCQSVRSFLERGGIILFGTADWSSLAGRPAAMTKFFANIKVKLPTAKNYVDTAPKGKGETSVNSTFTASYSKSFFNSPKKAETFASIRHYGNISATTFSPLTQTADGRITSIIQEKVNGKGTVIFTYAYNIIRKSESAFIENILNHLYGNIRKVSRREQLRRQTAAAPAAQAAVCDLSKPVSGKMILSKTGAAPQNPTSFKISGNKDKLIVEVFCTQRSPLAAKVVKRDDNVWNDDCVEVVIANNLKRDARIYHFIVNSNNALYDAQNSNPAWNCKNFKSSAVKKANGFQVRMEIPVKEFALDKFFRINVGREQISDKEITSWNKAPNGFPNIDGMKIASFIPGATIAVNAPKSNTGTLKIVQEPIFTRIYTDSEPGKNSKELKNIKITLPRNDLEMAQIVFYNTSEENYLFRIEPELKSETGDIFSFTELFNWRAPTGEVFAEIETPLNHANLISVPGGENKVLLLNAKTMRKPGTYKWSFEIVPVNVKMASRKINVTAEVLPLTLDQKQLPPSYGFGPYGFSWFSVNNRKHASLKKLQSFHMSHVMANDPHTAIIVGKGSLTISDDLKKYITDEKFLAANVGSWHYGYGVVERFKTKMKAAKINKPFTDPEMLKLFEKWCANWAKALKANKFDFKRFTVPLQDEPRTAALPDLIAAAKIMKKYGFRLSSTLATWTTVEDIRQFAPYLHLVFPWEPLVTSRSMAPEAKKIFKKHCPEVMPYLCSISGDFSPLQSYFRFRGIRTYMLGGSGIALWAVNSWRGNDYRSEENKKVNGAFLFHHGDDRGFVPTFRMHAFREAVEDLYYLKRAEKSSSPAVKALIAPAKLDSIMTQDSPGATAAWHEALLKALKD